MKNNRNIIFLLSVLVLFIIISFKIKSSNIESVKGNIIVWANNETYGYLSKVAKEFENNNKRVNIQVFNMDDKDNILDINAIEERTIPNIITLNSIELIEFKDNIIMKNENKDIIENYKSNFNKNRLEQLIIDGMYYGVPLTSNPMGLFIREDILYKYGYSVDDINTWTDLMEIGTNIFNRTNGEIRIFNYKNFNNIASILTVQMLEQGNVKSDIINKVNELYKSELVSHYGDNNYIFSIGSIEMIKKLNEEYISGKLQGKWICENTPSIKPGENKFYDLNGDNLAVIKNDKSNTEAIKRFIAYSIASKELLGEELMNFNFIPSSLYALGSEKIQNKISGIEGRSPYLLLCNIVEKAPEIENYKMYIEIINEIYSMDLESDS